MSTQEVVVHSSSIDKVFSPDNFLTIFVTLIGDANALVEQAQRAEIANVESFDKGIDAVKICNTVLRRIEDRRKAVVDPVNQRVKWFNAEVGKIVETVELAKKTFTTKTLTFKQAEDARREAEAAAQRKLAEDQAIADAEAATKAGDADRAEKLLDLAVSTPQTDSQLRGRGQYTGASGSSKYTWKGQLVDLKAICAAVASGELPTSIIKEISKSGMNKIANDRKIEGVFHGIKCFEQEDLNVR